MKVRAFINRTTMYCWKCGEITPVIYSMRPPNNKFEEEFKIEWFGGYDVTPEHDIAMGKALEKKYSWYREGYSNTMRQDVFASFCIGCDAMQGNWFVWKEMLDRRVSGIDFEFDEYVDYETDYDAIIEGSPEDEERKAILQEEECPKIGYLHSINHCTCNPKYGDEKYCQECYTAIMPFKVTKDWKGRKYHKKCWKKLVREGEYKCSDCGKDCNEFLQKFCDCDFE
jgi:hypothetical protein